MANLSNTSKARARLLIHHPFFASLVLSAKWIETRDIPTACTTGKAFYYNPEFMESLGVEENMFVQAHEVMHDALMHLLRMKGRNLRIWNMACDYSINYMLVKSGLKMPEGCLFSNELGPNSADVNYEILMRKSGEERAKRRGESGTPCPADDDGLPEDALGRDMQETPDSDDPFEMDKREQEVRQRVAQAATIARMAGKLPAGLERWINEVLNPRIAWEEYLQAYMTRIVKNVEDWSRRNRRFSNVYLPSRYSVRMGPIALIGDTSGSITNEDLNMVAAEFKAIAESANPERIYMIWADTEVAREDIFEAGDDLVFNAKGGGGTDMRVPLAHVAQYEPDVVVLVTDGYTPWPATAPDYPLIIVCTTNAEVPPIGDVIRIR